MKKFFVTCVVCFLAILFVYYFWSHPYVTSAIVNPISDAIDSYTQEELPYTTDFVINDIDIKSEDYYFNTLDSNCQAIYKSLANAVKNLDTDFFIKDYIFESIEITMEDVETTMHKFLLDHPEVFYLNEKYTVSTSQNLLGDKVSLNVSYSVSSKQDLDIKIVQIKNSIQEIINTANVGVGTTFEKEIRLHDILAKKVKYYEYGNIQQIPNSAHNIYGAFVENTAVCDGLSKAMQVLLDKIDVESIIVTGTLDNEAHAWNMIKLDNKWYNLDVTSDKSIKENNVVVHSYFNITTEEIKKTHTIDEVGLVPVASSEEYNYFVKLDKVITSRDNFDIKLQNILNNNMDSEKVEYKVENVSEVPEKTIKVLRDGRYYEYLDENMTRFVYYNILDNYVIVKR